jgi:hypothetical protein
VLELGQCLQVGGRRGLVDAETPRLERAPYRTSTEKRRQAGPHHDVLEQGPGLQRGLPQASAKGV